MTYFVPFRKENEWALSIDLETLTVRAERGFHPAVTVVEFVAKTLKQAWMVFFKPFEIEGFLKAYK